MKVVAMLLLCSCAPVVTAIPASLPLVTIDETLQGPLMSREAAEVIAQRRALERAKWAKEVVDLTALKTIAESNLELETNRANSATWWPVYGPILAVCSFVVGASLGATLVLLAKELVK